MTTNSEVRFVRIRRCTGDAKKIELGFSSSHSRTLDFYVSNALRLGKSSFFLGLIMLSLVFTQEFFSSCLFAVELEVPVSRHEARITSWFLTSATPAANVSNDAGENEAIAPEYVHFSSKILLLSGDARGGVILFDARNGTIIKDYRPVIDADRVMDEIMVLLELEKEQELQAKRGRDIVEVVSGEADSEHGNDVNDEHDGEADSEYKEPSSDIHITEKHEPFRVRNLSISPSKKYFAYSEGSAEDEFFQDVPYSSGLWTHSTNEACIRSIETGKRIGVIEELYECAPHDTPLVLSFGFHKHSFNEMDYLEVVFLTKEGVKRSIYEVSSDKIQRISADQESRLLEKPVESLPFFPIFQGLARGEVEGDINRVLKFFFEYEIVVNVLSPLNKYNLNTPEEKTRVAEKLKSEIKYYRWFQ